MPRKSIFVILITVPLLLAGCFGGSESDTMAEEKEEEMLDAADEGSLPLMLDESTIEDVLDYMGRSFDQAEMGGNDVREFHFEMDDGSVLLFAMKPVPEGGLVLDHFRADD